MFIGGCQGKWFSAGWQVPCCLTRRAAQCRAADWDSKYGSTWRPHRRKTDGFSLCLHHHIDVSEYSTAYLHLPKAYTVSMLFGHVTRVNMWKNTSIFLDLWWFQQMVKLHVDVELNCDNESNLQQDQLQLLNACRHTYSYNIFMLVYVLLSRHSWERGLSFITLLHLWVEWSADFSLWCCMLDRLSFCPIYITYYFFAFLC